MSILLWGAGDENLMIYYLIKIQHIHGDGLINGEVPSKATKHFREFPFFFFLCSEDT